jgi:hypothetical protein
MNRNLVVSILFSLVWTLSGCHKAATQRYIDAASAARSSSYLMLSSAVSAATMEHYIAERDTLEIVTSETELQKSWEAAVGFCGTIRCEIVSSSITMRTANSVPTGSIAMRVVPEDLKKLLAQLEKLGKIAKHSTDREDKTAAVVDTEARIKNLTAFRDNLRAMLAKPSAKVSDLVEIQKQLADTQSDLDSETAQRKVLANETEKIAVQISFLVEETGKNRGGFSEIGDALRESGAVLGDSTATLITTIFAIIPWLILILPAVWILAKGWARLKLRRKQLLSPPSAT